MRKLFGRDPALIVGAIEALVALAGATVLNLTGDQVGVVNAVLSAVLIAYTTWGVYDQWTAAVIQVLKAVLILAVTFGAHITGDQTALSVAALSSFLAIYGRTQLTAREPAPAVVVG